MAKELSAKWKKFIDKVCPKCPPGTRIPTGISRHLCARGGIILALPLPCVWKQYSPIQDREIWGYARLYVGTRTRPGIHWVYMSHGTWDFE